MERKRIAQVAFLFSLLALQMAFSVSPSGADPIPYKQPTYIYVKNNYTMIKDLGNCTIVVQSDNIVINGAGNTLQGAGGPNLIETGIELDGRKNVTIKNVVIVNYVTGIQLSNCDNIAILENNVTGGEYRGIRIVSGSMNNTISENNMTGNWDGIMFEDAPSNDNLIAGNFISENNFGIACGQGSRNRIKGNNITKNQWGLAIQDSFDEIIDNFFSDNRYIFQLYATNCTFYHNSFVNNSALTQTHDWVVMSPFNFWDNDSEGNYWSDYNGTDANGDGIGEIPYQVDGNNFDNFPLMKPYDPLSPPRPSPTAATSPTPSSSPIWSPSNGPTSSPENQPTAPLSIEVIVLVAIGSILVVSCAVVFASKTKKNQLKKYMMKRVSVGFGFFHSLPGLEAVASHHPH